MSTDLAVLNQELNEIKALVSQQKTNRLNDSLFSKEFAPHYMQLASQLSKSMMVPKAYQGKPQDLFVAMAMGYQIGLSVEQAIQAIAVINGKPCLWGDDMLALCMNHPEFVDIVEEPITQSNAVVGYRCTVMRKGKANHTKEFTLDMAKKAGLLGKQGPWTQYTERMLQLRARSFALRDKFPDALKGIKSREELEDYIDIEYKPVHEKGSRTEFLKSDILYGVAMKENKDDKSNHDVDQMVSDLPVAATTKSFEESPSMDKTGTQEIAPHNKNPELAQVSVTQADLIIRLLDEKGFTPERIIKALEYYEAESIRDLSMDSAEHFITQLNKL